MAPFREGKFPFVTLEGRSRERACSSPQRPLSRKDYFHSLLSHKFCISPRGNGIDTHRHFEAILTKGIPIIQSPLNDDPYYIKDKYSDLPVLWTKDYRDLSEDYLELKYAEILEQSFNFSKLCYSYWVKRFPEVIDYSSFWVFEFSLKFKLKTDYKIV